MAFHLKVTSLDIKGVNSAIIQKKHLQKLAPPPQSEVK